MLRVSANQVTNFVNCLATQILVPFRSFFCGVTCWCKTPYTDLRNRHSTFGSLVCCQLARYIEAQRKKQASRKGGNHGLTQPPFPLPGGERVGVRGKAQPLRINAVTLPLIPSPQGRGNRIRGHITCTCPPDSRKEGGAIRITITSRNGRHCQIWQYYQKW